MYVSGPLRSTITPTRCFNFPPLKFFFNRYLVTPWELPKLCTLLYHDLDVAYLVVY